VVDIGAYRSHWVELQGAHNVRDLAGLSAGEDRVRPGVLFRSDHLDELAESDLDILCNEIGLRAIIDLRTAEEVSTPPEWIATMGIARLHLPLIDLSGTGRAGALEEEFNADPAKAYCAMLEEAAPAVSTILSFVLQNDHTPALIHCAAGKDRTGITVAVLLAAAGVDEPAIIADYVATGERIGRIRQALSKRAYYSHLRDEGSPAAISPHGIEGVLGALRLHDDGARGFLRVRGTPEGELARWRELILETN
jgi:protein-tyrosine phosphatase